MLPHGQLIIKWDQSTPPRVVGVYVQVDRKQVCILEPVQIVQALTEMQPARVSDEVKSKRQEAHGFAKKE